MTLEQTGMLIIVASFLLAVALAWRRSSKENDTHYQTGMHDHHRSIKSNLW